MSLSVKGYCELKSVPNALIIHILHISFQSIFFKVYSDLIKMSRSSPLNMSPHRYFIQQYSYASEGMKIFIFTLVLLGITRKNSSEEISYTLFEHNSLVSSPQP